MRASVTGLMALLVLWFFPLNIHSFIHFANSSVNIRTGIHVLRTNRTLSVPVSLQPIETKYSRDASCNWVDLFGSVQVSSVQHKTRSLQTVGLQGSEPHTA